VRYSTFEPMYSIYSLHSTSISNEDRCMYVASPQVPEGCIECNANIALVI